MSSGLSSGAGREKWYTAVPGCGLLSCSSTKADRQPRTSDMAAAEEHVYRTRNRMGMANGDDHRMESYLKKVWVSNAKEVTT